MSQPDNTNPPNPFDPPPSAFEGFLWGVVIALVSIFAGLAAFHFLRGQFWVTNAGFLIFSLVMAHRVRTQKEKDFYATMIGIHGAVLVIILLLHVKGGHS